MPKHCGTHHLALRFTRQPHARRRIHSHSFTVQTTGRNKLDGRHALTRRGAQLLGCRLAEAGCFTAYMITQLRCSLLLGSGTTTVLVCRSVALMQE